MDYFSAFDGIGAAHVALQPLGCNCVGVSEIDKFCNELIDKKYGFKNYGNFENWREWGKINVSLIAGGSPCTAFSLLGRRRGTADPAGQLTLEFVRFVCRNAPKYFLWENVPQVLSVDGKRLWRGMLAQFSNRGYGLAWQVLDSRYFGVPQSRRRIFLIGCFGSPTGAAEILFDPETLPLPYITRPETGQADTGAATFGHCTDSRGQRRTQEHRERYRQNHSTLGTLATQIDAGTEQINRLVLDNDRVRYLTPLECERLQGFPDNYTAGYSDTQRYKMVGNSMPVPVIRWLGQRILAVDRGTMAKAG